MGGSVYGCCRSGYWWFAMMVGRAEWCLIVNVVKETKLKGPILRPSSQGFGWEKKTLILFICFPQEAFQIRMENILRRMFRTVSGNLHSMLQSWEISILPPLPTEYSISDILVVCLLPHSASTLVDMNFLYNLSHQRSCAKLIKNSTVPASLISIAQRCLLRDLVVKTPVHRYTGFADFLVKENDSPMAGFITTLTANTQLQENSSPLWRFSSECLACGGDTAPMLTWSVTCHCNSFPIRGTVPVRERKKEETGTEGRELHSRHYRCGCTFRRKIQRRGLRMIEP